MNGNSIKPGPRVCCGSIWAAPGPVRRKIALARAAAAAQSRGMRLFLFLMLVMPTLLRAEVNQFWIYKSANLQVDASAEEVLALISRGSKLGYTHLLLADSKFSRLESVTDGYFVNARRIREAAAQANMIIVPAVCPIGYSNAMLMHDPNLAEGLQVKNVPMIVEKGEARLESAGKNFLPGGTMEDRKQWSFVDETVEVKDGIARAVNPSGKNARLATKLKLEPWRQYHVRVKVKTKDFRGTPEVKVISDSGQTMNYDYLKVAPTQDWTEHHAVFHTLQHTDFTLYLGCWDGTTGELCWDDAVLEETIFVNLIRRTGAPLSVRTADGVVLSERNQFDPLKDPLMGSQPYDGCYTVWHEPPVMKTRLPDGTRLLVGCTHAVTVHDDQACICPSEPKTITLLMDAARRVHELWNAPAYMMSHDEIRVWNQCPLCQSRTLDAGRMLAENVRHCVQIMHDVAPKAKLHIWSDMFDPNHNARLNYYLARSDFKDSWTGLGKEIGVVPWYFEKRQESLRFFADRGHSQVIAGYYDSDPQQIRQWLKAAAGVPGVEGVMYTTWVNKYDDLEAFMQAALEELKQKP